MTSAATTPAEYLESLPADRKTAVEQLRNEVLNNLPPGFEEMMAYGMLTYVVPHSIYPAGYHCNPRQPLPFMSIGSQKNFIVLHHLGLYGKPDLTDWFTAELTRRSPGKPDMGKGCVRFKKPEQIPFDLVGELTQKLTVQQWIDFYEGAFKRKK